MAQNILKVALKYPPWATSSHSLISHQEATTKKKKKQPKSTRFCHSGCQVHLFETRSLQAPVPWSLPRLLQLLAVDSLPGDWAMLSISIREQFTKPDRGCDGVSQGAFVQPCHVYSCSKSNTSLFAMVLSFLVISQSDSWLKTALGLDI